MQNPYSTLQGVLSSMNMFDYNSANGFLNSFHYMSKDYWGLRSKHVSMPLPESKHQYYLQQSFRTLTFPASKRERQAWSQRQGREPVMKCHTAWFWNEKEIRCVPITNPMCTDVYWSFDGKTIWHVCMKTGHLDI